MADLNHIILTGRLTRDAELKYSGSGLAIMRFRLAVNNRIRKDETWQDEPLFIDAVLFGKRGEGVQKFLTKGKQIGIEGQLRENRWEQDGQPRSKMEIFVNDLQLLGGGGGGSAQSVPEYGEDAEERPPRGGGKPAGQPAGDDFEDDIPF